MSFPWLTTLLLLPISVLFKALPIPSNRRVWNPASRFSTFAPKV